MAGPARLLHMQQTHYLRKRVNYNDAGISAGVVMGTLPAGAIITDVTVSIATAFNAATTNTLDVGTAAAGAQIAAAAQTLAGATGIKKPTAYQALTALASDSDVYVTYGQTGTAATAGVGYVIIQYVPNNDL